MQKPNFETSEKSEFYVVGGTMSRDASSYINRKADTDLLEGLTTGKFCYVLTSRQMGKSSLMVRAVGKLKEQGMAVVVLDLTTIGQNVTPEQWYDGIQLQIGQQLQIEDELDAFWLVNERLGPLQRWMKAMREVVLEKCKKSIVIFIDEVDVVHSLSFSTSEFFAGIRAFYNQRDEDPKLNRLNFCLIGVTTTSDLIQDVQVTPLNVGGQRIELADFKESEAKVLAENLGGDPRTNEILLQRILYWTGGHPYLTQRFCREVAGNKSVKNENDIDRLCEQLFLSVGARASEDNLVFVRDRMLRSEDDKMGLLMLYQQILRGKRVPNDNLNPFTKNLRLSGITFPQANGNLAVRNRIYQKVFDESWAEANMPDAELRKQKAIYRKRLAAITAVTTFLAFLAIFSGVQWVEANNAKNDAFSQKSFAEEQKKVAEEEKDKANELLRRLGFTEVDLEKRKRELKKAEDDNRKKDADLAEKEIQVEEKTKLAEAKTQEANEQKTNAERQQEIAQNNLEEANNQRNLAEQKTEEVRNLLYAANIIQADNLYQSGNVEAFETVLNRTEESFKESFRGFEFYYLKHLTEGLVRFETAGEKNIDRLMFSPDGKYLVSTGSTSPLLVWNPETGEKSNLPIDDKLGIVYLNDFAFSSDGKWFVAILKGKGLMLWDTQTSPWRIVQPPQKISPALINSENLKYVAFTKDNKELLTISDFRKVSQSPPILLQQGELPKEIHFRRWNVQTQTQVGQVQKIKLGENIEFLKFAPDGRLCVRYKEYNSENGCGFPRLKGRGFGSRC